MRKIIRFASIVVTYRCNARCHMCHTWQHPTKKGEEITPHDLASLPSIPSINVTGGEPFLRDDLGDILSVLRPKTERLVISTNGYFTERIINVARQHPWIGVRISIEGLPKANDELRGIPDGFDHGLRTLLELHRLGLKDIGFGITLSDRNVGDLLELYQLANMMGVEFATAAVHNSFYFHKLDNEFTRPDIAIAELERLVGALLHSRKVKDWFRAYFNYGLINYIQGKPRLLACEMGYESFFLDPYGEILPCNVMERSMGNIRQRSFDEIWHGEEAQAVRRCVDACRKNCWMIGSAAEPIKQHIAVPLKWIVSQKCVRVGRRGDSPYPIA
ncbi:MAG: radical SAM protein [Armatimonadota bacterium]